MGKGVKKSNIIAIIVTFVVTSLAVTFGVLLVTKSGPFHKPGEIVFDDSVTELGQNFISENLPTDLKLESNVTVSTKSSTTALTDDDSVLYNILLPVTDFYSSEINISSSDLGSANLVSFWDLTFSEKLLSIDDNYFLDTFNSGAVFEYYVFSSEDPKDAYQVIDLIRTKVAKFPTASDILTFAQTGVTALSRGMTRRLKQTGDAAAFAANIADFLSSFDLTHTSNESSFSTNAHDQNICSDPRMIDVLTAIGLDIVELTGNHNQDCGDNDAIATIDQYTSLGIRTLGGGKTADDAALALEIDQKDTHITLLGYNYSTGGYTLDNTPGANYYTEEKATADIATAKARGDFVIVDVQFYECNSYVNASEDATCDFANSSAGDQIGFFRHLIDLGANIVVGTAAHQPQTFELYNGGAIYYGLGNLFFDQSWWPGTTRSIVLSHYFYDGKLLQTRLIPTIYDNTYQTKLMDPSDAKSFIERLAAARPTQE